MRNPEGIGSRGLKSDRKRWILTGGIGGGMRGLLSTDHTEFNSGIFWDTDNPKRRKRGGVGTSSSNSFILEPIKCESLGSLM